MIKKKKLSDICKLKGGIVAPNEPIAFDDLAGVPFVRMRDLGRYHLTTDLNHTDDRISIEYFNTKNLAVVKKGAIIIPKSGSVALNHRAILGVDAVIVSHICALEVIDADVNNKFLYYWLSAFDMARISKKTTGLDQISMKDLGAIIIPLPELNIQIQIAAILDKAQAIVDKKKDVIEDFNKLVKSTFTTFFGNPSENNLHYNRVQIGSLVESVDYGTSLKSSDSGAWPYLRMNNITYLGQLNLVDLKYIDLESKHFGRYSLSKGDLLFNRTNSIDLVGKTAVFDYDLPCVFAGYLLRVRVKSKELNVYYLWGFLNSDYGKALLKSIARGIIGMANINASEFRNIEIPLPPINKQNEYGEVVQKMNFVIDKIQNNSLQSLQALFSLLLQSAMRGDLKFDKNAILEHVLYNMSNTEIKSDPRQLAALINVIANQKFSSREMYEELYSIAFELITDNTSKIEQVFNKRKRKIELKVNS